MLSVEHECSCCGKDNGGDDCYCQKCVDNMSEEARDEGIKEGKEEGKEEADKASL